MNKVSNNYSFRVICTECGRTVIEAGKDGKITEIVCDKCEGIR